MKVGDKFTMQTVTDVANDNLHSIILSVKQITDKGVWFNDGTTFGVYRKHSQLSCEMHMGTIQPYNA